MKAVLENTQPETILKYRRQSTGNTQPETILIYKRQSKAKTVQGNIPTKDNPEI
jgi:hypothetical protein